MNPENCSGYSFLGGYSLHSLLGIHLLCARLNGRNSEGTCAGFWIFSLPNFLLCCSWPCKLRPTQQLPKLQFLSSSLRETISLPGIPVLTPWPKNCLLQAEHQGDPFVPFLSRTTVLYGLLSDVRTQLPCVFCPIF